ncbi:MAG: oligosaccharide flippase family protein [Burkholderiaceae bacterium]|nr:oligosaccharide flippase family protein [Burkholderiaceae bacterium]
MLNRRHYLHIALNISSMVLPMVAGLLVVPDLIQRLGTDRFGVLSISWVLVGYFGLLDLGLARGLTQYLASQKSLGRSDAECAYAARKVRGWMLGLGLLWSVILLALTAWVTQTGLKMPESLRQEASVGWVCLSLSVPPLLWAASSFGVMEASSRFSAVNAVRLPLGIASFVVPWIVAQWSSHLGWVLGGLMLVRMLAALVLAMLSRRHFSDPSPSHFSLSQILKFGGWLSVSNIVGPFLSYFDRFAIGALVSISAVTYYTVPFDVLIRLPTIPMAMMAALFPLLAQSHGSTQLHDGQLRNTFAAVGHLLVSIWLPGMLVCGLVGTLALEWWIGPDMANAGGPVWAWLSLGILLNGFAHLPYTLLHSAGRSDITAKFHLAELVPYLALVWWALLNFGIEGAAAVWALRCGVDTALLYAAVVRLRPGLRHTAIQVAGWAFFGCLGLWMIQTMTSGLQPAWPQPVDTLWLGMAALGWAVWQGRKLNASQ